MHIKSIGIVLLVLILGQPSSTEKSMTWKSSRPLTWKDFKGKPNPNSTAVALTASGLTFGYSLKTVDRRIVSYDATIEAHFYPEKSWYLKGRADNYILRHEQFHFNITELYARLFRQRLKSLRVNQNVKAQLDNLHRSINEALQATQKRYDAETNHSINRESQNQWETFIEEELNKLKAYASQ